MYLFLNKLTCPPFSTWQLYASVTGGIVFSFCLAPLFFEYTVELAYPVSEGLVGGFLCCFNNFIGTVFLALFFIPNLGTIWMNYVQVFGAVGKSKAEIGISNYFFCFLQSLYLL